MLVKENYFIYFATKLACQQICPVKLSPTELLHTTSKRWSVMLLELQHLLQNMRIEMVQFTKELDKEN